MLHLANLLYILVANQGQKSSADTSAATPRLVSEADLREDEGRYAEGLVHYCMMESLTVGRGRIGTSLTRSQGIVYLGH